MRPETPAPDYRRAHTAALQRLAASGDTAARHELQRRGAGERPAALDLARHDEATLRRLVAAWNDGILFEDRVHSRAVAEAALAELTLRARVDQRLWEQETAAYRQRVPAPPTPPPAPWLQARRARTRPWQRPRGSTCYPSPEDEVRARMQDLARTIYDPRTRSGAADPARTDTRTP